MDHNAIMRHFNRSWTELAAGGGNYYMKPQCVVSWHRGIDSYHKLTKRSENRRVSQATYKTNYCQV